VRPSVYGGNLGTFIITLQRTAAALTAVPIAALIAIAGAEAAQAGTCPAGFHWNDLAGGAGFCSENPSGGGTGGNTSVDLGGSGGAYGAPLPPPVVKAPAGPVYVPGPPVGYQPPAQNAPANVPVPAPAPVPAQGNGQPAPAPASRYQAPASDYTAANSGAGAGAAEAPDYTSPGTGASAAQSEAPVPATTAAPTPPASATPTPPKASATTASTPSVPTRSAPVEPISADEASQTDQVPSYAFIIGIIAILSVAATAWKWRKKLKGRKKANVGD
jgi:hypothetical protein